MEDDGVLGAEGLCEPLQPLRGDFGGGEALHAGDVAAPEVVICWSERRGNGVRD